MLCVMATWALHHRDPFLVDYASIDLFDMPLQAK